MLIPVEDITVEKKSFVIDESPRWVDEEIESIDRVDFKVIDNIKANIVIYRSGSHIVVKGRVNTLLELICSRCIEGFPFRVRHGFQIILLPPPAESSLEEEIELTKEDMDSEYFWEEHVDLRHVIFEQILLNIPMKPLCKETCKGLCPHCGTNLNSSDCMCKSEVSLSPFGILGKLNLHLKS